MRAKKTGPSGPHATRPVLCQQGRVAMWSRSPSAGKAGPVSADTSASRPTRDYSKWNRPSWPVLAGGLAGAALLIAADLSTLLEIKVLTVVEKRISAHAQHDWAVALLGIASLPLTFGAALRRARPALAGLVLIGVAVLVIALANDLPDTRSTGVYGERYDEAAAQAGPAFFLETAGAMLLLVTGVGGIIRSSPPPSRRRGPERSSPPARPDAPADPAG